MFKGIFQLKSAGISDSLRSSTSIGSDAVLRIGNKEVSTWTEFSCYMIHSAKVCPEIRHWEVGLGTRRNTKQQKCKPNSKLQMSG